MDAYEFLDQAQGKSGLSKIDQFLDDSPRRDPFEFLDQPIKPVAKSDDPMLLDEGSGYVRMKAQDEPKHRDLDGFKSLDTEEDKFQKWIRGTEWFSEFKNEYGEEPNLDDPEYDYRAAWKAGIDPQRYEPDGGRYHWSSVNPVTGEPLKGENHPTKWMEDFMQKTGRDPVEAGIKDQNHARQYIENFLGEHPDQPHPSKPDYGDFKLVQGDPVDAHRGSPFVDTKAGSDRAAMAVALSQELTEAGVPTSPSEVYQHMETISKELGWRGTLTPTEYYGMIVTGLVTHGAGQAALQGGKAVASLLTGFGVFEGLGYVKGEVARGVSGDDRAQYLADLMAPETNPKAREFVKGLETAAEFMIGGKVAHKTYRGFDASISKIKSSNWYRRATIRERGVMLSDMGMMIDGMKASGKSDGQILRQVRRTYGVDSPQWKEAWETYAERTGRAAPESAKTPEAKPTEKPAQEVNPDTKSTTPSKAENTPAIPVVYEQKGQVKATPTEVNSATVQGDSQIEFLRENSVEPMDEGLPVNESELTVAAVDKSTETPTVELGTEKTNDNAARQAEYDDRDRFFKRVQESPDKESRLKVYEEEVRRITETDNGIYDVEKIDYVTQVFAHGLSFEEQQGVLDNLSLENKQLEVELLKQSIRLTADDVDNPVVSWAYGSIDGKSLGRDYPGAYNALRKKFGHAFFRSAARGGQPYDAVSQELRDRGLLNDTDDLVDVLLSSSGIKENRIENGVDPILRKKKTYGFADDGEYADLPPKAEKPKGTRKIKEQREAEQAELNRKKAEAAKKESVAGAGTGAAYEGSVSPVRIELPELVEVAKALSGFTPAVRKKLAGANGMFYSTDGRILLWKDIFHEEGLAEKVLAHELGHLFDWLPHMKQGIPNGNILGRIASLGKVVRNHFMEGFEGGPQPLSKSEKAKLRRQVKRELERGEKWIDETIEKRLNVKPDDILAIWNSTIDLNALKKNYPGLYDYVAGLDSAGKKALVVAAMNGELPETVQRFAKIVREKTGKKVRVRVTPTKEELSAELHRRIMDEVLKRRLIHKDALLDELKQLTHKWKPFDKDADWNYTKYRYKPSELYADAISVLLNDPVYLSEQAPIFYNSFLNFLNRKPSVAKVYEGVLDRIKDGKLWKYRDEGLEAMFRRGDKAALEVFTQNSEAAPAKERFLFEYWDAFAPVHQRVRAAAKSIGAVTGNKVYTGADGIDPSVNPRYAIERYQYSNSTRASYLRAVKIRVLDELAENGFTADDLATYMFHNANVKHRVVKFDNGDEVKINTIANPKGYTKKISAERLEIMRRELDNFDALERAHDRFWEVRNEFIIPLLEEAELYDVALMEKIASNKDYARYEVTAYALKKHGGASTVGKIFPMHGTVADIGNPLTKTVVQDMSLIMAAKKKIAGRSVTEFLRNPEFFPDRQYDAYEVKNSLHGFPSPPKGEGQIVYMHKGKVVAYNVPEHVAKGFEKNPHEMSLTAEIARKMGVPFKAVFTEYNPGFWLFNIVRDFKRLRMNLPANRTAKTGYLDFNTSKVLYHYIKAVKPAFKSTFGKDDPIVQQMEKLDALIAVGDYMGRSTIENELDALLKVWGIAPVNELEGAGLTGRTTKFLTALSRAAAGIERIPKVAAYTYLEKNFPDMHPDTVAHILRVYAGSPAFLRMGSMAPYYNNLFLFTNAIKEGIRGDAEAMRVMPKEYAWRRIKYDFIPKAIMLTALTGTLSSAVYSDDEKEEIYANGGYFVEDVMKRIPHYDLANYTCIPLGMTNTGKAVYLRVPSDEMGRLLGAVFWNVAEAAANEKPDAFKAVAEVVSVMGGQVPSLSPLPGVAADTITYATGGNPYDYFYGRNVLTKDEHEAGGKWAAKKMLKHALNKLGFGIAYRFNSNDNDIPTEVSAMFGLTLLGDAAEGGIELAKRPVLQNVIGRFLKISDYGLTEKLDAELAEHRKQKARQRLTYNQAVKNIIEGKDLSPSEAQTLSIKIQELGARRAEKKFRDELTQKYGDAWSRYMVRARSNEERAMVFMYMLEDPHARTKLLKKKEK